MREFDFDFLTREIDERDFYYRRDNHHSHLSSKVIKYEKICDVNQYVFIPFAFNTLSS